MTFRMSNKTRKTHYQTLIVYFCDFMVNTFSSIYNFFKALNDVVKLTNRTSTIKLEKTSDTLLEFPSYCAKDDNEKNLNQSPLSSTSVDFRFLYPETFNALCFKRCCWFKVVWDRNINLEKIALRSAYGRQYLSSWLTKQLFHYCYCYYFSFSALSKLPRKSQPETSRETERGKEERSFQLLTSKMLISEFRCILWKWKNAQNLCRSLKIKKFISFFCKTFQCQKTIERKFIKY